MFKGVVGGVGEAALESHFNLTFKHLFSISCGSVCVSVRTEGGCGGDEPASAESGDLR